MCAEENYLKRELFELVKADDSIFEVLQQGSLDGIWYWDIDNPESEWMSPRFWEVFGFDHRKKKHLSSEWQDLINPEDLKVALENFKKHCADPNHPYDQVVRYRHKDGSTVWVRCRGIAIRDDDGKPIRMLGAHTDITQLKRVEEELKKRTVELEKINQKLQEALDSIKTLGGLLPICSGCKKIRDDKGYWNQIEGYIESHTDALVSHGLCEECESKLYGSRPTRQRGQDEKT